MAIVPAGKLVSAGLGAIRRFISSLGPSIKIRDLDSQVFASQAVGIKEVHDNIWLVSFVDYDAGYFGPGDSGARTARKRVWPKSVLPMSWVRCVTHVSGPDPNLKWSGRVDLNHRPPGPEPASKKSLSHRPGVNYGA